ncbi:MAG TPA: PQQ-binding-like beta-propeller repeat protein [Pirellulales bacterium]|jgi:outer membrane protein assembly factor BamB
MKRILLRATMCLMLPGLCLTLFVGSAFIDTAARADDTPNWPQFRGAKSLGIPETDPKNLPDSWSTTDNVLWKTDLPGRGWSSPIVWGNKVFLTAVINVGESEAPKKGLYFGGDRPKPPETPHQWKVFCLDLNTGSILWDKLVHEGPPEASIHLKNSFASETPVTDGKRVYAYFGNLGVFCFDMDGREIWSQKWTPHKTRLGWGTAASPVLYKDRLYIVNDNEEESYLACLDAATCDQIWRVERDEKSNWATPFIWENDLRTEIITPGTKKVRSYDLNGNLLYEFGGMSSITIAVPYAKDGLLYVSSGYVMDKKKPLLAIKPGASGDISLADDQTSNDFIVWCQKDGAPYNPTSIIYKGLLYVLMDRGFLSCFDSLTGEMIYDKQRLPEGKAFTSSPWAYNDEIFCANEDGKTFVIKAGREFEIVRTNDLAEDDMCMATPAIVGDKMLLRTAARLYCLKKGAKLAEPPAAEKK